MIDYPPRGLIVDLVTPLDHNGRPDLNDFSRLIRRVQGEAAGLVVAGVTIGEALALDLEARISLFATAVSEAGDKALLFEITARTFNDVQELLGRAEAISRIRGGEAGIYYLLTPLVFHSNRELPARLKELGRLTRRPFVLANYPELVGACRSRLHHQNIRTAILKKISIDEQVVGLVFDGDLARVIDYQRAVRGRSGFRFYDGNEDHFLDRPSSSGLLSVGACLFPQAWSDIVCSSLNIFDAQRLFPDHLSQIWQSGQTVRAWREVYRANPSGLIKLGLKMMKVIDQAEPAVGTPRPTKQEAKNIEELLA